MKKLTSKHALGFLFSTLFALSAHAAPPALYFSDLVSGPKTGLGDAFCPSALQDCGVIVTLWGVNLGSSQGASSIQIGGVPAAHVYYWGNADGSANAGPAVLYNAYQKIQTISFSIPNSASLLSGTIYNITVTVGGTVSNTLPFLVRPGNIYWVSSSGTNCDVSSGCGTYAKPFRTVGYAINSSNALNYQGYMNAGGTVYVTGAHTEDNITIGTTSTPPCNNGISDNQTSSIITYPGATFLNNSTTPAGWSTLGAYSNCHVQGGPSTSEGKFWTLSKISVKANADGIIGAMFGSRFIGLEITHKGTGYCGGGQSGTIAGGGFQQHDWKFFGNYVHDTGCLTALNSGYHTIYLSEDPGSASPDIPLLPYEIGWNYFNSNWGYGAIHLYGEHSNCWDPTGIVKVHENVVVNQNGVGFDFEFRGCTGFNSGSFTAQYQYYNNLLVNTGQTNSTTQGTPVAVDCGTGDQIQNNVKIWNNTIYGYGEFNSGTPMGFAISTDLSGGSTSTKGHCDVRNNIFVDTHNYGFLEYGGMAPAIASNNLWYSSYGQAAPSWDANSITLNPNFTNAPGNDFSLTQGSPAMDAGFNTGSVVARDILGTLRPQGAGYDIGAFEYASGTGQILALPPARPTGFRLQ